MEPDPSKAAQRSSGFWNLLFRPEVYDAFTKFVGGDDVRRVMVERFIHPGADDRVLDIGCGTGRILDHLSVRHYLGIDNNPDYIADARHRYDGRGNFLVEDVGALALSSAKQYDIVLAIGILHHIGDESARHLLAAAKSVVSDGGRVIIVDPVFARSQSLAARFLIGLDRGRHVRTPERYLELTERHFDHVRSEVCDLHRWLPYTQFVMECT